MSIKIPVKTETSLLEILLKLIFLKPDLLLQDLLLVECNEVLSEYLSGRRLWHEVNKLDSARQLFVLGRVIFHKRLDAVGNGLRLGRGGL
jgi:hypothetical protein